MVKLAFGSFGDSFSVGSLKSYLAEFIATLLFVLELPLLTDEEYRNGPLTCTSLQVCTTVILGLAIRGNITILTGIFYWIAQLLGSIVASFLLKFVTQLDVPTHALASGVDAIEGVKLDFLEQVLTVYTIINRAYPVSKQLAPRQTRLLSCRRKTLFRGAKHLPKLPTAKAHKLLNLILMTSVTTAATCTKSHIENLHQPPTFTSL
ncbi:unnamed protein product [Prunus armeniaca]